MTNRLTAVLVGPKHEAVAPVTVQKSPVRVGLNLLVVLVLYYLSGKFGLSLAYFQPNASPVWPPTGLALASLLVFGQRVWPAILIGAFLVNFTTAGSWATSVGIAAGNTLEAIIGSSLVRRYAGGLNAFHHPRNVLFYVLSAPILSTMISASVGVSILCLGGLAAWKHFGTIWATWWFGNAVSNLVLAPLLILWSSRRLSFRLGQAMEATALLLVTLGIDCLVFAAPQVPRNQPIAYLVYPTLVWGSLRFGPAATVTQIFLLSAIGIWGTLAGHGPFAMADPNRSLVYLQAFMGTTAVIALMLASVSNEAKRITNALRDSDERYRAFLTQSSEGIWRFEVREPIPTNLPLTEQLKRALDSAYLAECNEVMARMYGFSRADEIVGRSIGEFMPLDNPDNAAFLRSFFESGYRITEAESTETHRDGTTVYFVNNLFGIVENGHLVRVWGTQRDITARKCAEDALRASEHRYRTLFESIDEGFCVVELIFDPKGQPVDYLFLEANPSFERQTGLRNVIGKTIRELSPGNEQHWFDVYGKVAQTGQPTRCENQAQALDRWFDVYAFRLGDAGSRKVAILFNDITARKNAEHALRSAHDELELANRGLETRVSERTAKLRETIGELEAYSYSISHDMRAPLRAMQAYAQVLIAEHHAQLDATGKRYLERIMSSSNRLDKLIQDVLSYSRVSRAEFKPEPVHLDRLVDALVEEYPTVRNAEVEVVHPLGSVIGAEALLTQAISNLLTNAAKFVPSGVAPRIRIWAENRIPAEPTRADKRLLRLFIKDNGIGIAEIDQQRIFGIFSRVHSDKEYDGTGIGLSIVKKAVERMNGQIGLESSIGNGATFWVELPEA